MVNTGVSPETIPRDPKGLSVLSEFCMNVHDLDAKTQNRPCQYFRHGFFYTVWIDIHRQIM